MLKSSLTALAHEQLAIAKSASSGRSASTVFGGHENVMRQTVIAMAAGQKLNEHENPARQQFTFCRDASDSTLLVTYGRVRPATC